MSNCWLGKNKPLIFLKLWSEKLLWTRWIFFLKEKLMCDQGDGTFRELFTRQDLRIPLVVSVLVMIAQQFTGCTAVFAYSTDMFLNAGIDSLVKSYKEKTWGDQNEMKFLLIGRIQEFFLGMTEIFYFCDFALSSCHFIKIFFFMTLTFNTVLSQSTKTFLQIFWLSRLLETYPME